MRLNELDISKPELVEIAESWIFNTRNKSILYCKLDGDTYEEIAEKFNLSPQRTKEIVKEYINKISKHIQ